MKVLHIDGSAGVSGDMLLAALVDLTSGRRWLEESLSRLKLPGVRLVYPPRRRAGVEAIGVDVVVSAEAPHFDDVTEIEVLLARAELSGETKERAAKAFRKLAEAEQHAHRVAFGHAGFHEVGAADAVVDVVGTFALLELANASHVVVSPLRVGFGYIEAEHGKLPVPAPATAELLRGVPSFGGDVPGEYTTPTGAAIIATVADEYGSMPAMKVEATGYGPGSSNPAEFPNVLRVTLGEAGARVKPQPGDQVAVLEANVDDMTAEEISFAAQALGDAGALDVAVTPTVMKKGRPGHIFKVITRPEDRDRLCDLVLRHTTTLGVRYYDARRRTLARRTVTVVTEYGTGKVKLAAGPGGRVSPHAEYDSAARLAAQAGVPVRVVARALEAAAERQAAGDGDKKESAGEEPASKDYD
jgi:uncharacterized protein (TIGR00299 family) protein